MGKYIITHLNGLLIDLKCVYREMTKLQWIALKQSNVKFEITQEEFEELEKRISSTIKVEEGQGYWQKFWKHALIELNINPTPSVLEKVQNKFRTYVLNNSQLYSDTTVFLNECKKRNLKIVLADENYEEYVTNAVEKFNIKNYFHKIITLKEQRTSANFYNQLITELKADKNDLIILCTRVDKDYALVNELGIKPLLITRRFFSKVNTPEKIKDTLNAMNLLKALELKEFKETEEEENYENIADYLKQKATEKEEDDEEFCDESSDKRTVENAIKEKENETEEELEDWEYDELLQQLKSRIL